ncbi:unnamed protein product [Cyclocybe aegerita]|uniref:C3H1-type domain-containing protein n=1 Tax=Cyclocybe aegerita TaxID=1973307 RepID=A0A8S0XI05_CYCAE|nr:unnamed protein product [Cyclocybe aegerita]
MSRKSQKKRHTKPCRYFQVNKCPHSAEVCDFAHVMAGPIPATPEEKLPTSCKYYSVGRCTSGVQCRFNHPGSPTSRYEPPKYTERIADWAGTSANPNYPESPTYGGYNPYMWSPSLYSPANSFPSTRNSMLFSAPTRSRDSIDTATSLSSVDSDDVIVVTNDPKYSEHSHSHQSQVCIADDSPVIHVPPFYPTLNGVYSPTSPISPYNYSYGGMAGNLMLPPSMKPHTGAKPISKQKILKYKTKPCKFFPTEKGCPNGTTCTFIHDEGYPIIASPAKHSRFSSSSNEEGERKSYFPIPWRVIGGGVLVGVKKDEEDEADSDYEYAEKAAAAKPNSVSPIKIITRQRSNSIPPTPSTTQVKVEHLFSAESPGVL